MFESLNLLYGYVATDYYYAWVIESLNLLYVATNYYQVRFEYLTSAPPTKVTNTLATISTAGCILVRRYISHPLRMPHLLISEARTIMVEYIYTEEKREENTVLARAHVSIEEQMLDDVLPFALRCFLCARGRRRYTAEWRSIVLVHGGGVVCCVVVLCIWLAALWLALWLVAGWLQIYSVKTVHERKWCNVIVSQRCMNEKCAILPRSNDSWRKTIHLERDH